MIRVLLVEDNKKMSDNITAYLKSFFEMVPVYNLADAKLYLNAEPFDLVILDLMLPDGDGLSLLRYVKQEKMSLGVIVLTAKEALSDKLTAFEIGASDYLTKPFFMEELKARLQLMLKNMGKIDMDNQVCFKALKLDLRTKSAAIAGVALELNEKTYRLLEYLMLNKNILLYKEQIFDRICGLDSDASIDIVEVYMSRLRKQLAVHGYDKYLITRRGMGYLLEDKGDDL